MIRVGVVGMAVLGAVALLPAGAGAEVITPHTTAPIVVTPHTVTPQTVAPTVVPPQSPAPAPAAAPSPPAASSPSPSSQAAGSPAQEPIFSASTKPGWEGVKETHDAIERELGGDLLHQSLTEMSKYQLEISAVLTTMEGAGLLAEGEGTIDARDPKLKTDPDMRLKLVTINDGDRDPGVIPQDVLHLNGWEEDPGGIKEIIDGVFGTNMGDEFARLRKQ